MKFKGLRYEKMTQWSIAEMITDFNFCSCLLILEMLLSLFVLFGNQTAFIQQPNDNTMEMPVQFCLNILLMC